MAFADHPASRTFGTKHHRTACDVLFVPITFWGICNPSKALGITADLDDFALIGGSVLQESIFSSCGDPSERTTTMEQNLSPKLHLKTKEHWETYRPVFTQLYMDQDLALPKVMNILEDNYNVYAR